jgi:hypothetical protein
MVYFRRSFRDCITSSISSSSMLSSNNSFIVNLGTRYIYHWRLVSQIRHRCWFSVRVTCISHFRLRFRDNVRTSIAYSFTLSDSNKLVASLDAIVNVDT